MINYFFMVFVLRTRFYELYLMWVCGESVGFHFCDRNLRNSNFVPEQRPLAINKWLKEV
jgi:hypothetical protein